MCLSGLEYHVNYSINSIGDEMRLFICGNGLDLHLGFNTRFENYKDFLKEDDNFLANKAISIIDNAYFFVDRTVSDWSDLEKALSFDYGKYINDARKTFDRESLTYNFNSVHEQIKAADSFDKRNPTRISCEFTRDWYFRWIIKEYYTHLETVKASYKGILRKILCPYDSYITFNYTPSLEDVFGLDEKRILYIHNRMP